MLHLIIQVKILMEEILIHILGFPILARVSIIGNTRM